jgi:hypothetical protein
VVLLNTGERVGRIYAKLGTNWGQQWFCGLGFPHTLSARQPYCGTVIARMQRNKPLQNGDVDDRA